VAKSLEEADPCAMLELVNERQIAESLIQRFFASDDLAALSLREISP
jgi:hypothetical protein